MATKPIAVITKNCNQCGAQFSYQNTRGKAAIYCGTPCAAKAGSAKFRTAHQGKRCAAPDCAKPIKSLRHGLCSMHEARSVRTGDIQLKVTSTRRTDGRGYVSVKRPDLTISGRDGWCYEHRAVAHETHGATDLECHWCSEALTWDDLVVDHLDEDKGNNAPDNLALSCGVCNSARGAMLYFLRRLSPEGRAHLVAILP